MIKQWEAFAKELLVGRTIVEVGYVTDSEMSLNGWYRRPISLKLDNGTWLILLTDNEGNDGGALQVITNDVEFKLIPTL